MSDDDAVFVRHGSTMHALTRSSFESEDLLQQLIAEHPHVLAGAQISGDPESPIRWLLVRREAGIPDSPGGAARWAVDHLLLDQDGRPTFVEVKRCTDTRIRREVVGQMLDYAANATQHWSLDDVRDSARATWKHELEARISELIGGDPLDIDDGAIEAWWARVGELMRRGEVRLLFVADVIPRELRAIIEFLNAQMPRVEVLGVEVSKYVHEGFEAYVPRVIGQTERSRRERALGGAPRAGTTTREAFLAMCPEPARTSFARLVDAVEKQAGWELQWGVKGFSVRVRAPTGELRSIVYGYPPGTAGSTVPKLQAYTRELPPERVGWARECFGRAGRFVPTGQHTLTLEPDPDGFVDVDALTSAMVEVAEVLSSGLLPVDT